MSHGLGRRGIVAFALVALLASAGYADAETIFANDFQRVRAFDTATRPATATALIGEVELASAGIVTVGPDGNIYVIDRGPNLDEADIVRFQPDGTYIGVFSAATGLKFPGKMAFGPGGDLYVVGTVNDPIGVYRFDGTTGAAKGVYTSGVELRFPFGLVFDDQDRLYVSDPFVDGSKIQRYDATGKFEKTVLEHKSVHADDLINFPRGLCIGDDHALYIVDHFDQVVYRYDPTLDTTASYAAAIHDPQDCVFGADGTLYVDVYDQNGIVPIAPPVGQIPATPGPVFAIDLSKHQSLAISSVTLTPSTTTTTMEPQVLCGDANGSGTITAADALAVLRSAVGIGACPANRCDTDNNGAVSAADALRVLRVAVGQGVALTCPA